LFAVTPQGSQVEAVRDAIGSPSVFLFYGVLLVMVWATAWVMRV
jgi:hypothetical protein